MFSQRKYASNVIQSLFQHQAAEQYRSQMAVAEAYQTLDMLDQENRHLLDLLHQRGIQYKKFEPIVKTMYIEASTQTDVLTEQNELEPLLFESIRTNGELLEQICQLKATAPAVVQPTIEVKPQLQSVMVQTQTIEQAFATEPKSTAAMLRTALLIGIQDDPIGQLKQEYVQLIDRFNQKANQSNFDHFGQDSASVIQALTEERDAWKENVRLLEQELYQLHHPQIQAVLQEEVCIDDDQKQTQNIVLEQIKCPHCLIEDFDEFAL